ncbi:hypothetical protein EMGBS8_15880 [Verrucomicrobiota bacterium]|nr:hypothetical protein EMGBS8_15880 [Verrucomicrobiota bacterium]
MIKDGGWPVSEQWLAQLGGRREAAAAILTQTARCPNE